jgi:hypothetical protein
MGWLIGLIVVAVVLLKGFDRIAGRSQTVGAKRLKDAGVGESRPSTSDELGKLAALRSSGALTEDEFQAQKRKLLS